jgi:hypothetical protein
MIAFAVFCQAPKSAAHLGNLACLGIQCGDMGECEPLHVGALLIVVAP